MKLTTRAYFVLCFTAQSCDKCITFFVTDLPLYNFFEDVWPFVKEVNFRSGLLLRILENKVKLTYMMNSVNDKEYTQLESILYVETDMCKDTHCVCSNQCPGTKYTFFMQRCKNTT